jgi:hypothetical protein
VDASVDGILFATVRDYAVGTQLLVRYPYPSSTSPKQMGSVVKEWPMVLPVLTLQACKVSGLLRARSAAGNYEVRKIGQRGKFSSVLMPLFSLIRSDLWHIIKRSILGGHIADNRPGNCPQFRLSYFVGYCLKAGWILFRQKRISVAFCRRCDERDSAKT